MVRAVMLIKCCDTFPYNISLHEMFNYAVFLIFKMYAFGGHSLNISSSPHLNNSNAYIGIIHSSPEKCE